MDVNYFLTIAFVLANIQRYLVTSQEFNREYVGVNFSPYVKTTGSKSVNPCAIPYILNEISAMLRVVATKFSRVSTDSVGASNANETYINSTCIIARTAEAAALINKNNNNKTLSVLIGIMTYDDDESRTNAEVNIALEAAKIANDIYPETVEGLQIFLKPSALNDSKVAEIGVNWIQNLKQRTMDMNINTKIGIFTQVEDYAFFDLSKYQTFDWRRDYNPRSQLIESIDFFNCRVFPTEEMMSNGPFQMMSFLGGMLRTYGGVAKSINSKLQIVGTTGWSSKGIHKMQNIENMKACWTMMNEFASKEKVTAWLHEAFDNPWDLKNYGWWRLTDNKRADDESAYVEKILEKSSDELEYPLSIHAWIAGGVATAVIIILLLAVFVIHVYRNINFLQQILTDEEIAEFKNGSSDQSIQIAEDGNFVSGNAMRKPYDQSLEVSKDMLEIHWGQILGAGQFGSVHKAMLKGHSSKEVAVKTTKPDCPSTALKGLLSEIKILTHLGEHPNIVSICGAYTAELTKNKVFVAIELCELGSLKSHLTKLYTTRNAVGVSKDDNDIDSCLQNNLLRWSCEIATGMEHLGIKGVIHADLATRNVLLTSCGTAKIADFGLSRRLYEYSEYVKKGQDPLPWKWMAIESLKLRQFYCQSDVWSFGVTLWEIFSLGAEPYPGRSCNVEFIEGLENGLGKMSRPKESTPEMYQVMLDCWNLQPDMRPTFKDLKTRILEVSNTDNYMVLYDVDM